MSWTSRRSRVAACFAESTQCVTWRRYATVAAFQNANAAGFAANLATASGGSSRLHGLRELGTVQA